MSLKVTIEEKDKGSFRVIPSGSLDTATYTILEDKLKPVLSSSPRVLVFDMAGITYISSLGLNTMIKTRKALQEMNGTLIITNLRPQVKKVFDIVEALPNMNVFESIEEADAYLSRMQQDEIDRRGSA
ncbi:MAG: STAS domain-containing protein [Candidatus Omnitrophica bacterium]|nr:STAS domain-containing protein [Candidatus Omnitrophota bacterium]